MPQGLPVHLTSFIGRDEEVAGLRRLLTGSRLATLTGPGGAGKTRLAIEAARASSGDAVVFVDLAPIGDQALIPCAIADALGLVELGGEPMLETVICSLQSRRVLLVLDNCEHLIVGCAMTVERLLQACPSLTVLATSREPLNVGGEVVQRLLPLEPPQAATLFVERAAASEPGFVRRAHDPALIDSICRQLDGLPLAIELAAPYVRFLSVKELAAQLDQRFELLRARSPTAAARHQTLRALVDWSYELLTSGEQRLYRRLSVFAGGCTLGSIAGICWDDDATEEALLPLLQALVEKSLVLVEEEQGGETRYRMLETLRQHSREKLREAGEERELRRRHLEWFRDLAEQGERAWRGADQERWRRRLELDLENCRIALAWSRIEPEQRESGLRLAAALVWPWRISGHAGEALEWLTTLLVRAPPNLARARGLRAAGWLAHRRLGPDALPLLDEALSLARALGERSLVVATLRDLAFVRLQRGDPAAAKLAADEGLSLAQMPEVLPWCYTLLRPLGLAVAAMGRPEEGVAHLREAVRLAREQQDLYLAGLGLRDLGWLLLDLGDLVAARACLEDCAALDLPRQAMEAPATLACLVALAVAEGDMVRAVRLAGAASGLKDAWADGARPLPFERMEQQLKTAHETLGPVVRQAAWAEGVAMTAAEAIDCGLQQDSQDASIPGRPGGLTPRELEVARLLAGKLTNRQIAQTLVISERTADRHVENFLWKLHLSNRGEVAGWAVKGGLVPVSEA